MEEFRDVLRRLMALHPTMSLRELARQACVDPGHLSRIAAGRRPATPQIAAALDQVLSGNGDLVTAARHRHPDRFRPLVAHGWQRAESENLAEGLLAEEPTVNNAMRLCHEWLVTEPPQVYEIRTGRRIGESLVAQVEHRVRQLRLLDDHIGGLGTYELAGKELDATMRLLREAAYSQDLGRRLLVISGELCQLVGWVAADAGYRQQAVRFYLSGLRASHAGRDLAGAANNLSCLAYLFANNGHPREAVLMATSASTGARPAATATTRALLLERVAWAHAKAGDANSAERALGEVEHEYSHRQPDGDPAWTYWLDTNEITIMAGRCWTELHRPLRAVPLLEQATAGYTAQTARETALYLTWLAQAYLDANEVEQATQTALRALTLTGQAQSTRVHDRLALLHAELTQWPRTTDLDTFVDAWQEQGHGGNTHV